MKRFDPTTLFDVTHRLGPVLSVLDHVHAHAAETHHRLQHHRQRQLCGIHPGKLRNVVGLEEQGVAHRGQGLAEDLLVLAGAYACRQNGVAHPLLDPFQGVFGAGVQALSCLQARYRLARLYQVQGCVAHVCQAFVLDPRIVVV